MDEEPGHDPLPVPVAAALEAVDAWHTDDLVVTFAPDAVVDDGPGRQYRGHRQIGAWSDARIVGRHVRLRVTSTVVRGPVVRVRALASADGLLRPVPTALVFTVADDLVESLWVVPDARPGHV